MYIVKQHTHTNIYIYTPC